MPTVRALVATLAFSVALAGVALAQEPSARPTPSKSCKVTFGENKQLDSSLTRTSSADGCTWTFTDKNDRKLAQWESWPLFGIRVDAVTADKTRIEARLAALKDEANRLAALTAAVPPRPAAEIEANIAAPAARPEVDPAKVAARSAAVEAEAAQLAAQLAVGRTPSTSLQFVPAGLGWPEDVVQGPASGIKSLTTGFSLRPALFIWSDLNGTLTVDSDDPMIPIEVTLVIERLTDARSQENDKSKDEWKPAAWQDLLRSGYSVTMSVAPRTYQTLMEFTKCVQVGPDEASCLEALRKTWREAGTSAPTAWQSSFANASVDPLEYSSDKDAVTANIYYLISRWLGRDPAYDFTNSRGGKRERASKSEPIVLFAGISGLNKIAILDCQHQTEQVLSKTDKYFRCSDFARPSAQTLERARHFWAIYVEDADAPFDTTIEVEFGSTGRNPDYEEFDPRVASAAAPSRELAHTVRIGFRRFRIREAPSVAQVAFTRQGPNYGLRQWVRVYRQRSQWWAVPTGTLVAPGFPVTQRRVVLLNAPSSGGAGANALTVQEEPIRRLLFAAASVQWPQLRAKADDSGTWRRLWYNLPPDVTVGLADTNIFFAGGSWPIPVWRDRTYLTLGMTAIGNDVLKDGYALGQPLPLSTMREEVIAKGDQDWEFGFRIAISVELFRVRR